MMRRYRGIVCEKKNKYMIFLTEEGEFLRGNPIGKVPDIGEEADFQLLGATHSVQKKWKSFLVGPILVAAVLLLFFVSPLNSETSKALAFVQVNGESSFELGLDEEGNVISLESLDEEQDIELDDWKGAPVGIVLSKVVENMDTEELKITTTYEKEKNPDLKGVVEKAISAVQTEKQVRKKEVIEEKPKETNSNPAVKKEKQVDPAPTPEPAPEPTPEPEPAPTPEPTPEPAPAIKVQPKQNKFNEKNNNVKQQENMQEKETPKVNVQPSETKQNNGNPKDKVPSKGQEKKEENMNKNNPK